MSDLRIGILGTGGIAQVHAKSLAKLPQVKIVALCNHNIESAKRFASQFAVDARCFHDVDAMLREAAIDALYICLPPFAHGGQAEAAAGKGLHLFLEKPIALDLARAQSITAAVKKAGIKCQIGHHYRHATGVLKLKQWIKDGTAGRPLMIQGAFMCNALHGAWWRNPEQGGGQLIEQAIHVYDLARYFLGNAETACGFMGNLSHARFADYRVDDTSASIVRFHGGAIASICASNCAEPCKWQTTMTVVCEKLTARMELPSTASFAIHGGKVAEEIWRDKLTVRDEKTAESANCYDEASRNFVAGICDGEPLRSGIDDGLEGLKLVLAVARSAAQGGTPQTL